MRAFFQGIRTPFRGFSVLLAHRSLQLRLLIPYALIVLVLVVGLAVFFQWGTHQIHLFTDALLETIGLDIDAAAQYRWYSKAFLYACFYALTGLFWVIALGLFGVLTMVLSNILCSFFWEVLIEEVFSIFNKNHWIYQETSWLKRVMIPMGREILKECIYVGLFLGVWLLSFIPVLGPWGTILLGPPLLCYWYGFMVNDFALSVMAMPVAKRMDYGRKQWLYFLGIGIYALVPFLGVLIYPFLIVGNAHQMVQADGGEPWSLGSRQ
jgi:hypothetical protein